MYQLDQLRQVPEITEVILSLNYQPQADRGDLRQRRGARHQDLLRGRTAAARHRRRHQVLGADRAGLGHRAQRRRAAADRPAGRDRAASGREGQGDDRADAGRQPVGVRTGRDRRRRQRPALPREAGRRTRSPSTRSTPASTCSSRTRSIASRTTRRTRSSGSTSRRSSPMARRSSPTSTTATGSTSARRRSTGRCIATSWTASYHAAPFLDRAGGIVDLGARIEQDVHIQGPCFLDEGAVIKAGARLGPYAVDRPPGAGGRAGAGARCRHLGQLRGRRRGGGRGRAGRAQLPHRPQHGRR